MRRFSIAALVAAFCCVALAQSHLAQFGWEEQAKEKFALSNRARRKFPLAVSAAGRNGKALIQVQMTSQYPVNLSVQDARGADLGSCHYLAVADLKANCSFRGSSGKRYLILEDANQADLTEGARGASALNHVTLTINSYECEKNCPGE